MNKKFTTTQLFSLVDGRLSTNMGDVVKMLNHICDTELMTHHLPIAMDYLKAKNPSWYSDLKSNFQQSGIVESKPFEEALHRTESISIVHEIPQLKDEFDTSDFVSYMIESSLILNKTKS